MAWDGIVIKFHKQYVKEIGLTTAIKSYIQTQVLKKMLASISFDYRRDDDIRDDGEYAAANAVSRLEGAYNNVLGCVDKTE